MTPRRIVIVAVVCLAVWLTWRYVFPSDEAQIRRVLESITDAVGSGDAGEGQVAHIARAASMRNELDPQIVVDAGPPFSQISGRDAVVAAVARLNSMVRDLDIGLNDVQTTVAPDRTAARSSLTVEASFRDERGERVVDARELDVAFRRLDGEWVVSQVALVRALSPITPR